LTDAATPLDRSGEATRRRVLGDAHVDRAMAATGPFDAPFQDLITRSAWGSVWSRPDLTPRERSLVTIALLAGLGHHDELAMHIRATANTGASPADIREALLHVAIYAGVPAANTAIQIAKRVLAETAGTAGQGETKG
jgi:4-carboxymuconolactone decarboxylase